MHCRRYFAEAFFINDISGLSDEQLKELPETKALLMIRDIYAEENKLKDMSADDRLIIRKEKFPVAIPETGCGQRPRKKAFNTMSYLSCKKIKKEV